MSEEQQGQNRFPWWKTGVFYQIYTRSFRDANGSGVGDLQGIIDKLDYLGGSEGSLGVDAIWLCPPHPSPQKDFGYDISDYKDIDAFYGDMATFERLVEEAHRREIRVILDLVVNHTSDQHPWFKESRSSRSNPKRDWYIWRDGKGRKNAPPNNWTSTFGGSAWTLDELTGQYYLHSFLAEQPDLNWRNPEVRAAVYDIMRFWLDKGVDGFRLDVYNCYFKDERFRDNPRRLSGLGLLYGYMGQKHVHDRDQPELMGELRRMRSLMDEYPDRVLVGETLDEGEYAQAAGYYGRADDGLHLVFNFELLRSPWRPQAIQEAVTRWASALPSWAWPTWVLNNHDFPRHVTRYKAPGEAEDRARVAAVLMLALRGTPFLYYGEEIGMPEAQISRRDLKDPPGKRFWPAYKGRDGCRTPMQWNDEDNAGFTSGTPWLPVQEDYETRNVEAQQADPDSLWNLYRALIRLRKERPALQKGSFHLLASGDERVMAWCRELWPQGTSRAEKQQDPGWRPGVEPEDRVWVWCNLSHEVADVELDPEAPPRKVLFSTHRGTGGALATGRRLQLLPYEGLLAVADED